jgi:4-alpha-glucanotransferase
VTEALRALARIAGIDPEYTSWKGKPARASDETLLLALHALAPDLGIDIKRPDDAAKAHAYLERKAWAELVPPVVLAWDGNVDVPFCVPAEHDDDYEIEVDTEDGGRFRAHGRLFDLPADGHGWPGGTVYCKRHARLWLADPSSPRGGALGYHKLRWRTAGGEGEALVIAAPLTAHGGPGTGRRRWGVFAPVYGLASPESGQAGDLGTLRRLFDQVRARGGSYVATLPILAQFLDEPFAHSPYSPASRMMWNELYLDLHALAAEAGLPAPGAPPIVPDQPIDYREQYAWRRAAIDAMAQRLMSDPGRAAAIGAWATEHGIFDYAAFRAFGEAERTGWKNWRESWRDGTREIHTRAEAIAAGADGARVDSHVIAQWAMQRQLESLRAHDVALYIDLPVGVNCDAYEVWRWRNLFLLDLAAGAPPDALFLGGQDWGLPPLSPIAMRRDRYRYFSRCVRHHMRVAGMLRIDHVMGLYRLYCVPSGRPATDGVYIRYPYEELLAVLALESQRARCSVAGEDLGTVPDAVRPAMTRHGLYRLHVGQWGFPQVVGESPQEAPAECVASLNTHDTPTFAGWWRGTDIDDKLDLDLIDERAAHAERQERERMRAALLAFAGARLEPGDPLTEVERAMVAATTDLAVGPAEVVLLALDDLVLDPIQHNVPGTVTQRLNWQRRVQSWAQSLDPDRASPAGAATVHAVIAARPRDSE